jgi:deoxyribodipyrimidine photo-lyase
VRLEHSSILESALSKYGKARDIPSLHGTSRLSPYLHFGEIGPRQVWHVLRQRKGSARFLAELAWREFAYYLLHHFPATTDQPLRREFAHFPWKSDPTRLRAWQRGVTGVPLVDAGMRELWATGWMHNRVRMVAASFLVKNLLVP